MMIRAVAGFLALAVIATSGGVFAQEADRERARAAYGRGQRLFAEGQFSAAEAAFEEAYATIANPVVLLSIGESRERLGNIAGAVEAFETYLRTRPGAPDHDAVQATLVRLKSTPARVRIQSLPSGAAIAIDGVPTSRRTPSEVEMLAGEHSVTLSQEGYRSERASVTAGYGTRHEVQITLNEDTPTQVVEETEEQAEEQAEEAAPEEALEATAPEEEEDSSQRSIGTGVWVAGGIAGASLITGSVLGFLALNAQSDFDERPTHDSADKGERLAIFTDVAFSIAAVSAVTALVLFVTSGDDSEDEEEPVALQVAPTLGPRAAGVSAQLQF